MKKRKEIIQLLSADEPDYLSIISKLTTEDCETLNRLAKHRSDPIATRAIICLGYLGSGNFMDGIVAAAKSDKAHFRVTAAQALSKIKGVGSNSKAVELINELVKDSDIGVRKFALKAAEVANISGLKDQIKKVHESEENIHIKKLAETVFWKLKKLDEKPAH